MSTPLSFQGYFVSDGAGWLHMLALRPQHGVAWSDPEIVLRVEEFGEMSLFEKLKPIKPIAEAFRCRRVDALYQLLIREYAKEWMPPLSRSPVYIYKRQPAGCKADIGVLVDAADPKRILPVCFLKPRVWGADPEKRFWIGITRMN